MRGWRGWVGMGEEGIRYLVLEAQLYVVPTVGHAGSGRGGGGVERGG